jgi:hypothetical protein
VNTSAEGDLDRAVERAETQRSRRRNVDVYDPAPVMMQRDEDQGAIGACCVENLTHVLDDIVGVKRRTTELTILRQ